MCVFETWMAGRFFPIGYGDISKAKGGGGSSAASLGVGHKGK